MSLFGQNTAFGAAPQQAGGAFGSSLNAAAANAANAAGANPMKDVSVNNCPDDSISCLRFSPPSVANTTFLIAGSWDNNVRCWEIQGNGASEPKTQTSMQVTTLSSSNSAENI
jgi:WD40 repeat protein